ncbi:SHOCT domain-containing protein [Microbacterium excoecariae]|uniref:SHOCT domain-containing protein n=1 Tax=Microbacterium excoecariae TaxID=2715210 RepID=UPI0014095C15|nr:SHOCT domain-containing protein [Microbacterium excoecariae]NHI17150.1 SHOCT domain-containing protein [Microbacterium excoecariae]
MSLWESFWMILGWFFWAFVFVAYLMALFSIITDVFRDRELGGWGKAVWLLFLVFLPFLTALVYLIARGKGMSERAHEAAGRQRDATESYIKSVAAASPSDEIAKAAQLRDAGTITPAEFDAIKARALA